MNDVVRAAPLPWDQLRGRLDQNQPFNSMRGTPYYRDAVYEQFSKEEYARRYREEMQASTPRQKIAWLAQSVARGEPVTLLCSSLCTDENRCHRTVLRALLLEEVGQLVAQLGR